MSVVLIDGFDTYNGVGASPGLNDKWAFSGFNGGSMVAGRFGGLAHQGGGGGAGQSASRTRNLPGAYASCGIGFAHKNSSGAARALVTLLGSAGSVVQVNLNSTATGQITVDRNGTLLGTSAAGVILTTTWQYIEWSVTISDTVGAIEVKVDGISVLSLTAQDTRNGTPTTVDSIRLNISGNNTGVFTIDDLYIVDTFATLGERRIETLYPSADTAQRDFARSTGAVNFSLVDEAVADATDYVTSGTVGHLDLYDMTNLSNLPTTIDAVQLTCWGLKTDAASRQVAVVADVAGVQAQTANLNLLSAISKFEGIMPTKPGGGAWTGAIVNSMKAGPKVIV